MSESLDYTIKHHKLAKRIKIKINGLGKVEVVAPYYIKQHVIQSFVEDNSTWIRQTKHKLKDERLASENLGFKPPSKIILCLINQTYQVNYVATDNKSKIIETASELMVNATSDEEKIRILRLWFQKKAKRVLVTKLKEAAIKNNIAFNKVAIRGQKTRWGSCSTQKNLNINRNLLFLEPELVNYLFVHELCHILQANHSPKFWAQVALREPNYKALDRRLNQAQKRIPLWAI